MAKRNSGRRGRSQRRRAAGTSAASQSTSSEQATARPEAKARAKRVETKRPAQADYRAPGSVGARPEAPWHPWPLSESLILVGAVGTLIGFARGASGRPVLFAGLGAVMLGTLEFSIREHLAGYRAHTAMLAAIPTAIAHSVAALGLYALGAPRATWIIVPLAIDVPIFWFLFRVLRARFQDARRERVFKLGRR